MHAHVSPPGISIPNSHLHGAVPHSTTFNFCVPIRKSEMEAHCTLLTAPMYMSRCRAQAIVRYTHLVSCTRPVQHLWRLCSLWSSILPVIWICDVIGYKSPEAMWFCIYVYSVEQEAMVGHFHAMGVKLQFTVGAWLTVWLVNYHSHSRRLTVLKHYRPSYERTNRRNG